MRVHVQYLTVPHNSPVAATWQMRDVRLTGSQLQEFCRTPQSHQVSLTAINIKQINPKTRLSSKHADAELHNQILCMFQVTI